MLRFLYAIPSWEICNVQIAFQKGMSSQRKSFYSENVDKKEQDVLLCRGLWHFIFYSVIIIKLEIEL